MAGPGRNERCPCGSGLKVKYCCGERRGPSEAELAQATLHTEAVAAAREFRDHGDAELDVLCEKLFELPNLDHALLMPLPRLLTPDIERLRRAIEDDDIDAIDDALPAVVAHCDTPQARLQLLQSVYRLRDEGRIDTRLAATAALDLAYPDSRLAHVSLVTAAAVHAGAVHTASGLIVMAR